MFQIKLFMPVRIKGCPANGLPAIDFRRQHGLPEDANDTINISIDKVSENVVRKFSSFADDDGDIRDNWGGANFTTRKSTLVYSQSKRNTAVRHWVSAETLKALLDSLGPCGYGEGPLIAFMDELVADEQAHEWKAELAQRQQALIDKWTSMSLEERHAAGLCFVHNNVIGKRWRIASGVVDCDLVSDTVRPESERFPASTNCPALQAIVDELAQECDKLNQADIVAADLKKAAEEQQKLFQHQKEIEELLQFVSEHGDDDLKLIVGTDTNNEHLWLQRARNARSKYLAEQRQVATTEFCADHPEFLDYGQSDWEEVDSELEDSKLSNHQLATKLKYAALYPNGEVTVSVVQHSETNKKRRAVRLKKPNLNYVLHLIEE